VAQGTFFEFLWHKASIQLAKGHPAAFATIPLVSMAAASVFDQLGA